MIIPNAAHNAIHRIILLSSLVLAPSTAGPVGELVGVELSADAMSNCRYKGNRELLRQASPHPLLIALRN